MDTRLRSAEDASERFARHQLGNRIRHYGFRAAEQHRAAVSIYIEVVRRGDVSAVKFVDINADESDSLMLTRWPTRPTHRNLRR